MSNIDLQSNLPPTYNFSFSFTIPHFKNVYYSTSHIQYGKLTNAQQYELLEPLMAKYFVGPKYHWCYEKHADGRLHIHGIAINQFEDEIEELRRLFYSSYQINIRQGSYIKLSDIQKTRIDIKYFINYMMKDQMNIIYHMKSYDQQKIDHGLNKKGKFNFKIEVPTISNSYFNQLEEHLGSSPLSDSYPFGKKKEKKFILEI